LSWTFEIAAVDKPALYEELASALDALTAGAPDPVANMANAAALIWQYLPDLNWAGFYRAHGGELVLGPFQGKPACIRIAFGSGVCGTAAATLTTQCIADVHSFPGHIACDAASAAELVVPIVAGERLIGVLDLDSPTPGRFDEQDVLGCVRLMDLLAPRIG
jgi:GAF domain-containing protein